MKKSKTMRAPTIRERMEASGLSRREIAERAGLSKPYVVQLATGSRKPGPLACIGLARALKCHPADLRPDLAAVFEFYRPTGSPNGA